MNTLQKYNASKIEAAKKAVTLPEFKAGDTLDVHIKIVDGASTRIQIFKGLCIARKSREMGSSFTVRKIGANNEGIERIFPLYSPMIEKIDVVKRGRVRRAKLYYIRNLSGKKARIRAL